MYEKTETIKWKSTQKFEKINLLFFSLLICPKTCSLIYWQIVPKVPDTFQLYRDFFECFSAKTVVCKQRSYTTLISCNQFCHKYKQLVLRKPHETCLIQLPQQSLQQGQGQDPNLRQGGQLLEQASQL